ncbi:MAG: HAD family phosphatase [Dehalococcoidaceae bacterium]|nr:HAD family phosphatase [Dehalococcoidaceae bacterium]
MKYKLLVIDVDGTIVDGSGNICQRDIKAINRAIGKGVKVVLSTGRVPLACSKILSILELNGNHIFFDGALVYNPKLGDKIHCQPINRENVLKAIEYCRTTDTYLELYARDRFYADKSNWTDEVHKEFFGVNILLEDLEKIGRNEEILKMETIARAPEEYDKARAIQSNFGDCFRFSVARSPAFPGVDFVNIIEPGTSKGSALVKLAGHLNIELDNVIAVGDGLNDLSLIETAGFGIAMGNAFPELKSIADWITENVEEGGVARVIEEFIL